MINMNRLIKQPILFIYIFLFTIVPAYVIASDISLSEFPEYSNVYDAKRDLFQDGRDAIALAGKTDRLVLIEVGGDWCHCWIDL